MKSLPVLGIPIHDLSESALATYLDAALHRRVFQHIVTVNPEILVAAVRSSMYRRILQAADLLLPDGFGLILLTPLRYRTTGVALTEQLLQRAAHRGLRALIVSPADPLTSLKEIPEKLIARFPRLIVNVIREDEIITPLAADILFVTLGYPAQEAWIAAHRSMLTDVRIAVGVGGAVDYLCGTRALPPVWIRRMGLEWLIRLVREPRRRWRRMYTAVVIFPLVLLCNTFHGKHSRPVSS